MSVTAPDTRITTYNPVVATTEFPAVFPVFDNDDVKVYINGEERDDFAITGSYVEGISINAKAVFAVGVTGAVQVVGSRDPHRTNRFSNGGPLPVRDMNLALDTLEGEMQEVRRDVNRSAKVEFGQDGPKFPAIANGYFIGWLNGKLVNLQQVSPGSLAVGAFGETLLSSAARPDAFAALGIQFPVAGDSYKHLRVKADGSGVVLQPDFSVASKTLMKSLDTGFFSYAWLSLASAPGGFILANWADYSAIGAVDTGEGYVIRSTFDTSKCWVRSTLHLTPEMFGAVGDGATNDVVAFRACFAVAKIAKLPMGLGAKTYQWTIASEEQWDFTSVAITGFHMFGAGPNKTTINITGAPVGTVAWRVLSTADWYRLHFENFSIAGSFDGCLFAIGKDNFSDPVNLLRFQGIECKNSSNSNTSTEAVRLNYIVNSIFDLCVGNTYADGLGNNRGTAVRVRQVCFCTFVNGSFGNGQYGVRYTDGISYGNVWLGCDYENIGTGATGAAVSVDSASAVRNIHTGGTYSLWTNYAVQSNNGDTTGSTILDNPNPNNGGGPSTFVNPAAHVGIRIRDGAAVTTPTAPLTTVPVANTTGRDVEVTFWGLSTLTSITVDGAADGRTATSGTFILRAGKSCSFVYTGTLTWRWRNIS